MSRPERLVAGLLALALLIAVGWPLARLGVELLASPSAWGAWAQPQALRAAGNTALLASGATLFAVLLGVPLGVLLARAEGLQDPRWRTLVLLPYVVPPYVSAIAWITLLNPTTGWLNAPLRWVGLPPLDIYGLGGMIFVIGLESTPLVVLATADALDRLDASLEEQARVAHASPLKALLRVTVPLCAPAIAASAGMVFSAAAAAYGVPYLLASGTSSPDWVLTTQIATALDLDPALGRPRAAAWSAGLLALSVALPMALSAWLARRRFTTVGGKAQRPARLDLGRGRSLALGAVAAFLAVGVGLPLLTLLALSVTEQVGRPFGPSNWSLAHYAEVLGSARDRAALLRSLLLAAGTATVTVTAGAAIALLERRGRLRWLSVLASLPYAVPGTVLALGLLLAWSQEVRLIVLERLTLALSLADTLWLLLLAYAVKFLALPTGAIGAALRSFDPSLEEAARISGASPWRSVRRVTLPLLAPTLLAAWILVFLPAFTEVTMSVLLSGPRTRVVGAVLFDLQTYGDPPGAAALAVVVSAIVVGLQLLAHALQHRRTA